MSDLLGRARIGRECHRPGGNPQFWPVFVRPFALFLIAMATVGCVVAIVVWTRRVIVTRGAAEPSGD